MLSHLGSPRDLSKTESAYPNCSSPSSKHLKHDLILSRSGATSSLSTVRKFPCLYLEDLWDNQKTLFGCVVYTEHYTTFESIRSAFISWWKVDRLARILDTTSPFSKRSTNSSKDLFDFRYVVHEDILVLLCSLITLTRHVYHNWYRTQTNNLRIGWEWLGVIL